MSTINLRLAHRGINAAGFIYSPLRPRAQTDLEHDWAHYGTFKSNIFVKQVVYSEWYWFVYPRQTLRRVFLIETSLGANGHEFLNATLLNLNLHTHLHHWKAQMLAEPPVLVWSQMIKSNLILRLLQIFSETWQQTSSLLKDLHLLVCRTTAHCHYLSEDWLFSFSYVLTSSEKKHPNTSGRGWPLGMAPEPVTVMKVKKNKKNCMSFLQDTLANEEYGWKAVTQ